MKKSIYLSTWFLKARFFGIKKPLQTVLFISDRCNLSCRHCSVYNHTDPHDKTLLEIREELQYSYDKGSRFVDIEGGEPFLWRDGNKTVNAIFDLAKEIGFYSCTVTTNAQLPFDGCRADSIWVSLDGVGEVHDRIRGEGAFAKLEKNIAGCGHHSLSVNMVINRLNMNSVEETIRYAESDPSIQSISLNFHTPFPGTEELAVDQSDRERIIDSIIAMKRGGASIMNSYSGLKRLKMNNFKPVCWVTNFIMPNGERLDECQGKAAGLCDRCGFGMAGEMRSLFDFKADTIWAGMRLRVNG